MAKQLGPMKPMAFADLTGYLFAWRPVTEYPHLIDIEGTLFVSVYPDEASLDEGMRSLDVTDYTVKHIDDGKEFASSILEIGVHLCINARRVGENNLLRYTELRTEANVIQKGKS